MSLELFYILILGLILYLTGFMWTLNKISNSKKEDWWTVMFSLFLWWIIIPAMLVIGAALVHGKAKRSLYKTKDVVYVKEITQ